MPCRRCRRSRRRSEAKLSLVELLYEMDIEGVELDRILEERIDLKDAAVSTKKSTSDGKLKKKAYFKKLAKKVKSPTLAKVRLGDVQSMSKKIKFKRMTGKRIALMIKCRPFYKK